MAKTEEGKLSEQVEFYLNSCHILNGRTQAVSNVYGESDRWFLFKGVYVRIELKTDKGAATELQLRKLEAIRENGGIGAVVRSVSEVQDIVEYINMSHCDDAEPGFGKYGEKIWWNRGYEDE